MNECPLADSDQVYPFDFNDDSVTDFSIRAVADGSGGTDYFLEAGTNGGVGAAVAHTTSISGTISGNSVHVAKLFTPGYGTDSGTLGCETCFAYYPVRFKIGSNDHYGWVLIAGHAPSFINIVHGAYQSTSSTAINAGDYNGTSCGSADFDGDSDSGTDQDIEAFWACWSGTCCSTCGPRDFNGDGIVQHDADVAAFFRVLGGGNC